MARIRTIKPEFFRHERLQDLEVENPGKYPMMVFEGLFTLSDKNGVFEWKPRTIKLDILPFIPFDMEETLNILKDAGFVKKYEVDGKVYGFIPTFEKHQRITGKEASDPPRYPQPPEMSGKCDWGNNGETMGKHEGRQEREGKGKGKGKETTTAHAAAVDSYKENFRNLLPTPSVVKDINSLVDEHGLDDVLESFTAAASGRKSYQWAKARLKNQAEARKGPPEPEIDPAFAAEVRRRRAEASL